MGRDWTPEPDGAAASTAPASGSRTDPAAPSSGRSSTCSTDGCERSVDTYAAHGKCCLVCGIEAAAGTHLAYCRSRHAATADASTATAG